ncbi:MAG: histidine kinase [Bacteroidota bacterium]
MNQIRTFFQIVFSSSQPPINDKWIRRIGYPIVILSMSMIFGWKQWRQPSWVLLFTTGIAGIYSVSIWEGIRRIVPAIRILYPGFANTTKRLVIETPLAVIYTLIVNNLIEKMSILCFGAQNVSTDISPLVRNLIVLIPVTIFLLIYESRYFLLEWKKDIQKAEALSKAHILSQFEALKKQLDPHFLFNSLNTLASLIHEQNSPAQEYLARLSDAYRYILETRDQATITLSEELEFLDAYMYLNKVRFRDNLLLKIDLPPETLQQHVLVLSLQLLIENAIKHNIISRAKPLTIHIFEAEGALIVENNKQLKSTLGHSTKIGLQNIQRRYKLLNAHPVTIHDHPHLFQVKLPFLSPQTT